MPPQSGSARPAQGQETKVESGTGTTAASPSEALVGQQAVLAVQSAHPADEASAPDPEAGLFLAQCGVVAALAAMQSVEALCLTLESSVHLSPQRPRVKARRQPSLTWRLVRLHHRVWRRWRRGQVLVHVGPHGIHGLLPWLVMKAAELVQLSPQPQHRPSDDAHRLETPNGWLDS